MNFTTAKQLKENRETSADTLDSHTCTIQQSLCVDAIGKLITHYSYIHNSHFQHGQISHPFPSFLLV